MKLMPILFSTPMVQALQDNRKWQTRRVVTRKGYDPQNAVLALHDHTMDGKSLYQFYRTDNAKNNPRANEHICGVWSRYGIGDILWARETWYRCPVTGCFGYRADANKYGEVEIDTGNSSSVTLAPSKWCPSIHMPRAAARSFFRVTDVRAERVQDISNEDAIAEGIYEIRHNGWYWCDPATTKTPNCSLATTPQTPGIAQTRTVEATVPTSENAKR